MVDNVFIQCDYCKAKIRMRFQMGYFDIPFDFPCPECGVHIHGLRRITEEHSLKLNNAAVVEFDLNEPHYYADFSVELDFKNQASTIWDFCDHIICWRSSLQRNHRR